MGSVDKHRLVVLVPSAILIVGIAVQLRTVFDELILPVGERIWEVRQMPPWERTGYLSSWAGSDRTEFLGFLRDHTPSDATVVFFEQFGLYSWKPALQYFLYPRHVRVCPQATRACLEQLQETTAYFVLIEERPVEEMLLYPVDLVPYPKDSGYGLYVQDSPGVTE